MTPAEWEAICCNVRDLMVQRVGPAVTPISISHVQSRGEGWATGNYLALRGRPYLLTNAHVIDDAAGIPLAHLPRPTEDYIRCRNPIGVARWPIDVALLPLGPEFGGSPKSPISAELFDEAFTATKGELLFWLGFPGSTAKRHEPVTEANTRRSWFGELEARGIPMLTQQCPSFVSLVDYDQRHHVVLHYPAEAIQQPGQPERELANPKGMSGSLLWDTKFVATKQAGQRWSPEHAKVSGLIWAAHEDPEVVVATKIEHIRPRLLNFLREEAAYLQWIDRGKPLWDEIVDWTSAEREITGLE